MERHETRGKNIKAMGQKETRRSEKEAFKKKKKKKQTRERKENESRGEGGETSAGEASIRHSGSDLSCQL